MKARIVEAQCAWRWSFRVNPAPATWRQRVAAWLRRTAGRIDGNSTLAVELRTTPLLAPDVLADCMGQGYKAIHRALEDSTRTAAMEAVLRELAPRLYADQDDQVDQAGRDMRA